jgi:hypothetical protein
MIDADVLMDRPRGLIAHLVRIARVLRRLPPAYWFHIGAASFIARARPFSQVTYERLIDLYLTCLQLGSLKVKGSFVECGVWMGGCAAVMARSAARQGRMTWLFDSFEGMPEASNEDGPVASDLAAGRYGGRLVPVGTNLAPLAAVRSVLFDKLHLDEQAIKIEKGWFQTTLPSSIDSIGIALLRIDADWYESTKVCLEQLYDSVVSGGYVVIDDYGAFPGCQRAVDDFLESLTVRPQLQAIDESVRFRKP